MTQSNDMSNLPECLYRYCGIHRFDFPSPAQSLLTQGKMFFASPADFNDPFDCKFRMRFEASPEERQRFAFEVARDKAPPGTPEHLLKEVARRFSNTEAYDLAAKRFANRIYNTVGVLCFSTKRDNILMWSHYAEMHKGICLEFRRAEALDDTLPVNYSVEYPVMDFFEIETKLQCDDAAGRAAAKKFIELIYLTKASQWKYEDEWRLVDPRRGRGLHEFPTNLLSGIIFGCRTTEQDRERVRGWLQQASATATLYQARVDDSEFRLDISPI